MTILLANIGTSDLAVKMGDFYLPVGFDRSEPNIDYSELTENEKNIWERELRQEYISNVLCEELDVKVDRGRFSFRELTYKILEAYKKDENIWHQRIRPGRIWGVINSATEARFRVKKAYLFVTNQSETETKGYPSDSIYLFGILEKWFQIEIPQLRLIKIIIPQNIAANNQDELLNYYYQFFNRIDKKEIFLISLKGGTPQMQNALKIQAVASDISKQLFINPKLSIKNILAGKPSECILNSYWRYIRTQKYHTVKVLLQKRWDFDGAEQIMLDWQKILKFLIREKITDEATVLTSERIIERIIIALKTGVDCLNLDNKSASQLIKYNYNFAQPTGLNSLLNIKGDEKLLNLYTQCRIHWDLGQVANLLAKMSSFYEEVLERLIIVLKGEKYFVKEWTIDTDLIRQQVSQQQWKAFLKIESRNYYKLNKHKQVKLEGRFTQRNFIEKILVPLSNIPTQQWSAILDSLRELDFWFAQRNRIIHSAAGVSKRRMDEVLKDGRQSGNKEAIKACQPGQIRSVMAKICRSELRLVRKEYQEKFVGQKSSLYIYSGIVDWVVKQLESEILTTP